MLSREDQDAFAYESHAAPVASAYAAPVATPIDVPVEAVPLASFTIEHPVVEVGTRCKSMYQGKYYDAVVIKSNRAFPDGKRIKIRFMDFRYCPIVLLKDLRF